MSNTPPEDSIEQRRKVLKGALAASGVATMGYSGSALASFQCVTSTSATGVPGFKKSISTTSNWAWLKLQVFITNKSNGTAIWKAVKIPNGSDPSLASTDSETTVYYFDDLAATPMLYSLAQLPNGTGSGISLTGIDAGKYVYVIIYFKTDGAIAGFFPTYAQSSGTGYPAQGSCLTSLNPNMVQTNIFYGG